jgi:hypothetical protein
VTFVRSFEGFRPPPRFEPEADPFTKAKIEESDARTGTYALIETIPLSPVDADPAKPATRSFTTDKATLDPAWYRITWEDASADTFVGTPIYFPLEPAWQPSVDDVAALIRARTRITGGKLAMTFNDETKPTGAEVERLIRQAVLRVSTSVGMEPCNADLEQQASYATSLYAAMLVEQSYYPEQTTREQSSFQSLYTLWKETISTLAERVNDECGEGGVDGGEGGEGVDTRHPVAHFDNREIIGPLSKPL